MLPPRRHTFSHFQLRMQPVLVQLAAAPTRVADELGSAWVEPGWPGDLGLPAPIRTLLAELITDGPRLQGGVDPDNARQE
jgi:A/G-specific adenine glycosylase